MLVLSRKENEQIIVGNETIVLTVIEIRGDKVRLGIDAPKEMSVHRREVYEAIRRSDLNSAPVTEAAEGAA